MKKFASILIVLLIFSCVAFSAYDEMQCSDCKTNGDLCEGAVLATDNGVPVGCNRDWFEPGPDPCEGTCYRCSDGSSNAICVYTGNSSDSCPTATNWTTTCGTRVEHDCGGLWGSGGSGCTCSSTGGVSTTTACTVQQCS